MPGGEHFIVAIGASAGGLEAIHEFFDHMPEQSHASFVIVQHLSPDYKSLLVDLVSRHTHMKVAEAQNNVTIEKNCIYVIPNNKLITIKGKKLLLEEKAAVKSPNNAIDVFLYALAKEKKTEAIAVILSGTGTDGTKGVEAIKENGGLVIVQDPATAKFDGMPNSAIHAGDVDYVLPPAQIHEEIINYINEPILNPQLENKISERVLEEIFQLIHKEAGFDFNYYKTPTIIRRISRRMLQGEFTSVEKYVDFLRGNPEECKLLGKDFLIGVTKFFRDTEAFKFISDTVIESILAEKEYGDSIKVWVSACSTGEEAYSMAILLNEAIEKKNKSIEIKIFATDLEESNINIAANGVYPLSIENDVSKPLLEKYFTKNGKHYTIIPKVRKQVVFAQHNIIKDPPFIKNDLVSCRNMLIYMSPVLQQRIFSILLFSVKRYGYLFLGPSENPNFIRDTVNEISSKWKIFKKITDTKLSTNDLLDLPGKQKLVVGKTSKRQFDGETKMQSQLWDDYRKVLSRELNFAGVYIDSLFEVKEAIGNYEKLLTLPKKSLKLNILQMIPTELSGIVNSAVKKSWKDRRNVALKNIRYSLQGESFSVNIFVRPPEDPHSHTMVIFNEHVLVDETPTGALHLVNADPNHSEYVRSLETELIETKNNLQLAVEDLETLNEELQSSNEELLSANEELQSSNEELQSLNEELHTLNTEHQLKIRELLELNDDLNNYFRSTDIGQIFLDGELRIRKFNPASSKMINFIDSDLGRPISHISTNIKTDNLIADIERVMRENDVIEKEVQLINGKNLLMRILPYLTREKKNEGVIISFIDITTITNLNNIIRGVFNSSLSAIFAFQSVRDYKNTIVDFSVLTANHAAKILNKHAADFVGMSLKKDLHVLTSNNMLDRYIQVVENDYTLHTDIYLEAQGKWFEVSAAKMSDGFVATFTDVTEKKLAEQRLKKNYVELISVKDNLKKLNAELETKVIDRTQKLSLSEERFRLVARATNDALWDWDFVNNKVWWSNAFYNLFGYNSEEQTLDRNFWLSKIHPDDRKEVSESMHAIINSDQKQWNKEYRFIKADGTYASILDRGYVLHDEYGTPYRMLGSMLDLTDLKTTQQALSNNIAERKFLAESMPLIVWTADAEGNVDFVNNQFELYTGVEFNRAIQQGWQQAIHPEDLKELKKIWTNAIQKGNDFHHELRIKVHQDSYRWNILRAKARKDEKGKLINWVVTTIDIHEQKVQNEILEQKVIQRTKELQEINYELEVSNHDLQQFASVASHDLQEPLRKIHMFSKLIRDRYAKELSTEASPYLEKIMQSSSRMKSIITNVLNFSRLSSDDNKFEVVNVAEIIQEILDDFEVTIKERKAKITLGDSCDIEVIPGQIRQVFQNLISNSLKFAKPNEPPVIDVQFSSIGGNSLNGSGKSKLRYCKITFTDNGIGFDEQFKDNIFALFHRLHSKDKYEGTGIGLAIVKKIIEKHNGTITASSKLGEGSVFEIVLPFEQGDLQEKRNIIETLNNI